MIIYKYLDPDGATKTIENNSILVRAPDEYNDPFDCLFDSTKKEKRKALKLLENYILFQNMYSELIVNNKSLIFGEKYTAVVKKSITLLANSIRKTKKYIWQPDIAMYYEFAKTINKNNQQKSINVSEDELQMQFNTKIDEIYKEMRKSILIGCFGSKNNSILMWSHYAFNHTGACIEFEIDSKDFRKVRYSKKLTNFKLAKAFEVILGHDFVGEKVNFEDDELQFALTPVLTKYIDWKYEKEVRCGYSAKQPNDKIHPGVDRVGKPIKLLEMPSIKKIYIGCKADKTFIEEIKKVHKNIPLYQMVREEGKYTLVAKPLEDQD